MSNYQLQYVRLLNVKKKTGKNAGKQAFADEKLEAHVAGGDTRGRGEGKARKKLSNEEKFVVHVAGADPPGKRRKFRLPPLKEKEEMSE